MSKKEANSNLAARSFPNDLVAWYPRRCFQLYTQQIARKKWTIDHELDVQPFVVVYGSDGRQINDFDVTYSGRTSVTVEFANSTSGTAHLIARTTQSDYDVAAIPEASPSVSISANGVLTIATLAATSQVVSGSVFLYDKVTNQLVGSVPVSFVFGVGVSTPATTAWSDYTYARMNGRRYNVRQVDIGTALSNLPDDCYFRVTLSTQQDTVFLLTHSPYQRADTNPTQLVAYASVEVVSGISISRKSGALLLVDVSLVDPVVGVAKTT